MSSSPGGAIFHFVILAFRFLQLELPHANEINHGIHLANTLYKADMKSYLPLETAAIFFSGEPFSKTGYKLGVCHDFFIYMANSGWKEQTLRITK